MKITASSGTKLLQDMPVIATKHCGTQHAQTNSLNTYMEASDCEPSHLATTIGEVLLTIQKVIPLHTFLFH